MAGVIKWIKEHIVLCCIIAVAVITAAVSALFWGSKLSKIKDECSRMERNHQSMLEQCDTLTLANGKHIARVKELELTNEEMFKLVGEDYKQISELGIKNKYLQHVISTGSHTEVNVDTIIKDSIIFVPVIDSTGITYKQDTMQVWSWKDDWVKAHGTIYNNKVEADFEITDSLLIVAYRVPKRWWFIKWGTKYVEMEVVSSNPHTKLKYAKSVKLRQK